MSNAALKTLVMPLDIRRVNKSFAQHHVLKDISFSLLEGEIFGLIGLNGAGKTTLIKILLDLITSDSGEITIFGTSSKHMLARKKLSYLPEKFVPSRYLYGAEYLNFAMRYFGKPLELDQARIMVASLDLDPTVLDKKVGSYSKGMGQKLGLAGAFLVEQPFMILDEPMSGLDPSARIKLKHVMLAEKHKGKTLFFSSHILSDIDEICDRIGVIHEGKILYIGAPASFKSSQQETSLEKAFLKAINA